MKRLERGRLTRLAAAGLVMGMTTVSCTDLRREDPGAEQRDEMSRGSVSVAKEQPSRSASLPGESVGQEGEKQGADRVTRERPAELSPDAAPTGSPGEDGSLLPAQEFRDVMAQAKALRAPTGGPAGAYDLRTVDGILAAIKDPELKAERRQLLGSLAQGLIYEDPAVVREVLAQLETTGDRAAFATSYAQLLLRSNPSEAAAWVEGLEEPFLRD